MNEYFENHRKSINNKLDELLPKSSQKVGNLFSAMRYSMLNGGKRIRPLLCIAAADSISSSNEATVVAASAIEMMHVYSLIHDDLPSMDNDDLRRGIASCHIKYNEATAILAGDALQALAFETLSNIKSLSYENQLKIIKILSNNIGCSGMVKGQALDLDTTYKPSSREELDEMHRCKTGALIEASVLIGAITTQEMTDSQEFALKNFAQKIGLAFQIKDDVLDVESSTEAMGKLKGSDAHNKKCTYTSILGLDKSKDIASKLYSESIESLSGFDERASELKELAKFIISRAY